MASFKSLTLKGDRQGIDPDLAYMIGKTEDMEYHVKDKFFVIVWLIWQGRGNGL